MKKQADGDQPFTLNKHMMTRLDQWDQGRVKNSKSRLEAAVRELREETGLFAYEVHFLFEYQQFKVFLIKTKGIPHPKHEISQIGYYTRDSTLPLSYNTKSIIETYWTMKMEKKKEV